MEKLIHTIAIIIALSSLISITDQAYLVTNSCSGKDTYVENSPYKTNLFSLLSSLASAASRVCSYNATVGSGNDRVCAHFYCRRGFKLGACRSCVRDALSSVMQQCKNAKEAIVWYEECTLSYSPGECIVESEMEESIPWAWWYSSHSVEEISSSDQFNQTLGNLFNGLIHNVGASGNKPNFFVVGEAFVTVLETLYGTVECNPSISPCECRKCLRTAWSRVGICCGGARWAAVFLSLCQVRYELGHFSSSSSIGPFSSIKTIAAPMITA